MIPSKRMLSLEVTETDADLGREVTLQKQWFCTMILTKEAKSVHQVGKVPGGASREVPRSRKQCQMQLCAWQTW